MIEINENEFIYGDKFKDLCSILNITYSKIDHAHRLNKNTSIVLTHNGDIGVSCDLVNAFSNLKLWFGQNILCNNSKIHPLPIGLENLYIQNSKQKKDILQQKNKLSCKIEPKALIYSNFSVNTYADRIDAYNYFSKLNWCNTQGNHGNYDSYCDDIINHYFVVSPIGGGLDCHRTWDILYLNRYPIMKKYYGLQKLYSDLPVVFVDQWQEVTPEFLEEQLKNIKINITNNQYNFEKIKFSYWKNFIIEKIKNL